MPEVVPELLEPIRRLPGEIADEPTSGTALCLSGGGYRAMLFHVGVLWRLNEAGWLPKIDRVSSVSGGSITAAALATAWPKLAFDDSGCAKGFPTEVAEPLLHLARETLDARAIATGAANPFKTVAEEVAAGYRKHLLGDIKLSELVAKPTFVFNATNLETGDLFRFTKQYIADWRLGRASADGIDVATAVACSSAFPPVLSPFRLDLGDANWYTQDGSFDGTNHPEDDEPALTDPGFRRQITLTDGGVYDNLGLETAWKTHRTVLVSDAGGQMGADADPPHDPARQMLRVLKVIDNQVRSLRKIQIVKSLEDGRRDGLYLGIRSDPASYDLADTIPVSTETRVRLAKISTRLAPPADNDAERLINWGYALCDTGLRKHVVPGAPKGTLPYANAPIS